jgi:hypothetical protein
MGAPRGRGDRGDPHHSVGGHRGSVVWPGDDGPRWQPEFLDRVVFGAWRKGVAGGIGSGGEMGCSWALYIGWGG